jgi:hypothetical protein
VATNSRCKMVIQFIFPFSFLLPIAEGGSKAINLQESLKRQIL